MNAKLLHVQPSELKFPFQLNRVSTCWLQLTNKTDHNVAFKVKTTHPRKYCVRPNVGVLSPGSTSVVKVGLQAQKEFPLAIPKDKFLIQSIIAPTGVTVEDITSEMFRKDSGDVEEQKLRVIFVTADPPSPIPEGSEEESSPGAAEQEYSYRKNYISALFDSASTVAGEFQELLSEVKLNFREAIMPRSVINNSPPKGPNYERGGNEENFQMSESTAEPEVPNSVHLNVN
ncbi:vesicle-associated protein 3-1-like isoform X3 [Silene latifolia]|uniref:vesicle-associated protein 3-1-like isoform X3 n=1 Tax=Silene latifolia TaxID=37657 RepID=UPI003D788AE0